MKKFLFTLSLITVMSVASYGQATQTYVTNNMAAGLATITTQGGILTTLTAYSTNQSPTYVRLYDGYATATNGAWTNYTVYTTNVVTSYVTSTGITNNLTNLVIKTIANEHAALNGEAATPTLTLLIPAASSNGTLNLVTFDDPLLFGKRLTLSNSATGLSILAKYRSQ